jgi:hypothetical protein
LNPEVLLGGGYGHKIHVWDMLKRRHVQELDLGAENQMVLELRPAHDPTRAYGFMGVAISTKDLSASVWMWHRENGKWAIKKVIEIPAEPADPDTLPPLLQGFKAVPPFITDINLSLDDRFLYVSCFGTGEFLQYDVTDPFRPRKTGSVHLGGIVRKAAHPKQPMPRVRYWVIFNNQFRFPPEVVRERWPDIMARASIMATQTSTKNSMRHLFAQAEVVRLKYGADVQVRVMAVPESWVPPKPGSFVSEVMNELADLGEKMGADPSSWRTEAP